MPFLWCFYAPGCPICGLPGITPGCIAGCVSRRRGTSELVGGIGKFPCGGAVGYFSQVSMNVVR